MWTLDDRSLNTVEESTNAFANGMFAQVQGNPCSRNSDEVVKGSLLDVGQIHRESLREIDDIIKKWPIYDNINCVHENANAITERVFVDFHSSQENFFKNEAELMAIQWKGLKQHSLCYEEEEPERNGHHHVDDRNDDDDDVDEHVRCPSPDGGYVSEDSDADNQSANDEIDYNLKTNFLAEAISAAIRVKGLAY